MPITTNETKTVINPKITVSVRTTTKAVINPKVIVRVRITTKTKTNIEMNSIDLNLIIGIAEVIFFATLSVLAVYLIISLKKFLSSISRIENEVIEITNQISPVIADMKFVTDDLKEIVERSKVQFHKIEDVSENVITKGEAVVKTLNAAHFYSTKLLANGVNFVSAISNGYRTFKQKLMVNSQLANRKA